MSGNGFGSGTVVKPHSHASSVKSWLDEDSCPPEVRSLLRDARVRSRPGLHGGSSTTAGGAENGHTASSTKDGSLFDDAVDVDGEEDEPQEKLTTSTKLAFGLPNLALSAMYLPTSIHINKFFADTLLVQPGTLAIATAIARAFDTLLDPFFGWLSDNTSTRWGRRKPYIMFGAPFNAIFYFLLFTPPASLSPSSAAVWFCVFFALYLIIPMSLPHHALGPELTQDYKERSSLYAYGEVFSLIGVILAAAAPGLMAQFLHDPRMIFAIMSGTVAVLLVITYAILILVIKEPDQAVHTGNPLIPGLRRAWRNIPFRVLVIASVVGSMAHHCSSLMFPFFISYCLHPHNDAIWLSICLMTYFGSSAISIPLWCWLAQHFDKKNIWLAGWGLHLPSSFLLFFLPEGAKLSLLSLTFVTGASFGGASYLYKAIQADAIDYDELRTTKRREGQYITFWALIPKLVAIPSASIPLVVLEQAGYVPNRHPQTGEVQMTIRILTTLLPCLLSAIALAIAVHYPITKHKTREIKAMIDRRRRAIRLHTPMPVETDPVSGTDLPHVSGGLSTLSAEFCWYLDYFSQKELKILLARGQKALIWTVAWCLFTAFAVGTASVTLICLGSTAFQVIGVMGVSLCLALLIFHVLRIHAAYQFDLEKQSNFRKSAEEYFKVMTFET